MSPQIPSNHPGGGLSLGDRLRQFAATLARLRAGQRVEMEQIAPPATCPAPENQDGVITAEV
jgi:hypothetical protein